jgi:hypothetical protein
LDASLSRNTRAARGSGQSRRSVYQVPSGGAGRRGFCLGCSDGLRIQVQFLGGDASTAEDGICEAN